MANNFTEDANCVALWRFENNLSDSKGSNTWDADVPAYSSSVYKEGSYSYNGGDYSWNYLYLADGDLDAGFPFKNGDTGRTISICGWVRFSSNLSISVGDDYYIFGKMATDAGSFAVGIRGYYSGDECGRIRLYWWNGAAVASVEHAGVYLFKDKWYHVAVTYDHADQSYRLRVYDADADDVTQSTGMTGYSIAASNTDLSAIQLSDFDGYSYALVDELVITKDILSVTEIDAVRDGTYPPEEEPPAGGETVTDDVLTLMLGCDF